MLGGFQNILPPMNSNRPLNVMQLVPALEGGGVERGTLEMARAMVDRGWKSVVMSAGGRMVAQLEKEGSIHVTAPIGSKSPLTLLQLPRLLSLCRSHSIDILHARSRIPAWLAWFAVRLLSSKDRPVLVTTMHGLHSVNFFSSIMTRGDHVIAVSETAREFALEHYSQLKADRLHIVFRGVDPGEFPRGFQPDKDWQNQWFEKYPRCRGARLVCLPGRITRRKGHLEFVELIAAMRQRDTRVLGLIVGSWDPRHKRLVDEIKAQARFCGIEKSLIWAGHRSDIRSIYAICDLVVSLSQKPESFGRSMLEPLSMGKRCAGLDHGGVGEVLEHMFPAGKLSVRQNAQQWADQCMGLLESKSPFPLPNAFPLGDMLTREMTLYEEWVNHRMNNDIL